MKVKLTPASPLLRVSSEDPPVKAKTKSSLEYEAMVLSPFVLIASDTSLSRRWVKILVFSGRVESKAGSSRISYVLCSSLFAA